MSADLISRNADLRKLEEEGFELEIRDGFLLVSNIPCVTGSRTLARGMLVCALQLTPDGKTTSPLADHTMHFAGPKPCHSDGSVLTSIINSSADQKLTDTIVVNHYLSSKPEKTGVYQDLYEKVTAYERHIAGAARSHDPSANGRTGGRANRQVDSGPFTIPDTSSARYRVADITRKLAVGKIAIIGLGGTGSHILDQLSKTPVSEIHTYDGDQVFNHNLFRSPGAPLPELALRFPSKVEYYAAMYSTIHGGIVPHFTNITDDNIVSA